MPFLAASFSICQFKMVSRASPVKVVKIVGLRFCSGIEVNPSQILTSSYQLT